MSKAPPKIPDNPVSRREFLWKSFLGLGLAASAPSIFLSGCGDSHPTTSNLANLGPLEGPDENGLMLPKGFTSKILARSGEVVPGTEYVWHGAPDGGAVYENGSGWIYVSNAECPTDFGVPGGAGALVFDSKGEIVDAYRILTDTNVNCAGGPTPWNTWLSCEEIDSGQVWECDPYRAGQGTPYPALGVFKHEAAAVDPETFQIYLTEDQSDGNFYRFTPASKTSERADLSEGKLEVAVVEGDVEGGEGDMQVRWVELPDPSPDILDGATPTRHQIPEATRFRRAEGAAYRDGVVYFATTSDNRVWALETATDRLTVIYDANKITSGVRLTGVDNLVITSAGEVVIAEDNGEPNCGIGALLPSGELVELVRVVNQPGSEITGPAFDPSQTRLYFSSQRAQTGEGATFFNSGITYCIEGPFFV